MDAIDGIWIKARLTGVHGEQAALAREMGIDGDKMSKILRGLRQVKASEVPGVMRFFGVSEHEMDQEFVNNWRLLNGEQRYLLKALAAQLVSKQKRSEDKNDAKDHTSPIA